MRSAHYKAVRRLAAQTRLLSTSSRSTGSVHGTAPGPNVDACAAEADPVAAVRPIRSLLIANRGEIALRIDRTARRLGIQTTAVYTDADAWAQHTAAGAAQHRAMGVGAAAAGYLDGERLVGIATRLGIDALHPGYGFLSENNGFAAACGRAGVVFVGPPAEAMAAMGDKARSKALMTAAGVACVPGYHGPEQDGEALLARTRDTVGFPALLKSVRGGGGKGMRIVATAADFAGQLRSARAEARASFGPGGEVMLVERYVQRPRHVEVQVFADRHGGCVALGERDCSVQRRHQKVLEESPAPGLSPALRADLWATACRAALAVGYVGAGTVEFLLDRDANPPQFYFMEMNTRLQVEHPVTEMVTGADLVEWQLRIAAGEPLPWTQDQIAARIAARGAAVEVRIYAEDPARAFFPDSGRLLHLVTPLCRPPLAGAGSAGGSSGGSADVASALALAAGPDADPDVRVDAGFVEGDVVSEAYDGMLAKLIVRGPDRAAALRKLDLALRRYQVVGPRTNIEFLKRLCRSPAFVAADLDTGFIDRWHHELFAPVRPDPKLLVQAALALLVAPAALPSPSLFPAPTRPHGPPVGFSAADPAGWRRLTFRLPDLSTSASSTAASGDTAEVALAQTGAHTYAATVTWHGADAPPAQRFDRLWATTACAAAHKRVVSALFADERVHTTVVRDPRPADDRVVVFQGGDRCDLVVQPAAWRALARRGGAAPAASVVAPMPCKVLRNEVVVGQRVGKGAPLVLIESMKMETVIRSPQDGRIKKLAHKEGDVCKAGTVLVLFEEEDIEAPSTTATTA